MHENIKYTLALDKSIASLRNINSLIDKSSGSKEELADWQCIYGDIVYGTHFFIYAKFIGENVGPSFEVSKIQLYIQNYSGPVSIGFTNYINISEVAMSHEDPDNDDRPSTKKKYSLEFGLRGMNMKNNFIELDKKLILNNFDIITAEPIYSPINNSLSKVFNSLHRDRADFVDELFMARVGEDIVITEEGLARLNKLVVYSHYNKNEIKLDKFVSDIEGKINNRDLSLIEDKNIKWPCKPRNSTIRIID